MQRLAPIINQSVNSDIIQIFHKYYGKFNSTIKPL